MNNNIPEAQRKVADRIMSHAQSRDKNFSFDPFTIMAICNCIISVVKLLYMCYSTNSVASAIKKDSVLHRVLLKREIRKNFKDKNQRKVLYSSFSDVSKTLSQRELLNLLESIQEQK